MGSPWPRAPRAGTRWLSRRGYLRAPDADHENEAPAPSPAEALVLLGTQRGALATRPEGDAQSGEGESSHAPREPSSSEAVVHERFNLHASVTLRAEDDVGRERLCRYVLRPAFSLERIAVQRDGHVSYRVKKVSRSRATHRVMTPLEFLGRLAALIPPPRYPLLRLHGVLAPRHAWRDRIVPKPRQRRPPRGCEAKPLITPSELRPTSSASQPELRATPARDGRAAFVLERSTWTFEPAFDAADDSRSAPSSPSLTTSAPSSASSETHAPLRPRRAPRPDPSTRATTRQHRRPPATRIAPPAFAGRRGGGHLIALLAESG